MQPHTIDDHHHHHVFLGADHQRNERRTWIVVALTAIMMVIEIIAGTMFGSMALVADGWHMSTHAAMLAIAALAYRFARSHAHDRRFSFGTGKVGELAGYTSAVALGLVAILIGYESVLRLLEPLPIRFEQALPIAVLGLLVNLLSAWLLGGHEHHGQEHSHHEQGDGPRGAVADHSSHGHQDTNLRAAYFHVLADALTSVTAIVALLSAWFLGAMWVDPLMGLVGAVVIAVWSVGLIRGAGGVLLDMTPDDAVARAIRIRLEQGGDRITDLHVWRIGPGHNAAVVSLVCGEPQSASAYKDRLADVPGLSHITIEADACPCHQEPAAA